MALVQKAFSDIITFSRSSNATRIGPTGLVEYAPHNLLLQSQTFDNASWTAFHSGSVAANAGAAPDGTITADLLTWTSTTASGIYQNLSSAFICTFSVFAKTVSGSPLIGLQDDTGTKYGYFNLSTGAVTSSSGLSASSITSVGNGWYRCVIVFASAPSSPKFINGAGAAGSALIWGAQLSVGPYALDYTPTTSAAVYGPRFDFDPVTLAARGLLVEEQRTNLVNYSTVAFIGSQWQQYGSAVLTENYSVAPDGTITAGRILSSGFGTVRIGTSNLTNGTNYAASIWLKSNTGSNYSISLEIGDTLVGTFTVTPTWQRFSGVGTPFVTGYNFIDLETAATLDISVWGCQIEQGGFATSLIPTSGSTVTRSADVASVNTLSPWFNATEGTIFAEALAFPGEWPPVVSFCKADNTYNTIQLQFYASGVLQSGLEIGQSGVTQAGLWNSIASRLIPAKIAGAYKANDAAVSSNGGVVATDTSVTLPSVELMRIGLAYGGSIQLNGYIRRIAYYPRRLTNAELQALSA